MSPILSQANNTTANIMSANMPSRSSRRRHFAIIVLFVVHDLFLFQNLSAAQIRCLMVGRKSLRFRRSVDGGVAVEADDVRGFILFPSQSFFKGRKQFFTLTKTLPNFSTRFSDK
jgi:hypothetical protein